MTQVHVPCELYEFKPWEVLKGGNLVEKSNFHPLDYVGLGLQQRHTRLYRALQKGCCDDSSMNKNRRGPCPDYRPDYQCHQYSPLPKNYRIVLDPNSQQP